jgi:hypothetical protein
MNKYFYLCLALFCHLACTSSETKISEERNRITITTGGYVLTTQAVAEVDQAYLLVGQGRSGEGTVSDASIAGIPLERADALRKQYGDFTQRKSSGTDEVRHSVVDIQLIITDSSCKKALKEAQASRGDHGNPVIRITGRELRIDQAIYRDTPMQLNGPPANIVLADSIELEQASYFF